MLVVFCAIVAYKTESVITFITKRGTPIHQRLIFSFRSAALKCFFLPYKASTLILFIFSIVLQYLITVFRTTHLYPALDEQGKKVGVPIKASRFGKVLRYDVLQQHFEKLKKNIEKNQTREYLRPIIAKALQESTNLAQFKKLLSANNIGVVFRLNDQDRLYGVSFIDYQNKAILNGSRLGKEFSANVVNDLFKGRSADKNEQKLDCSQYEQLDSGLGFSLFEQHGVDLENEEFVRKKVVEERRRRGRGM